MALAPLSRYLFLKFPYRDVILGSPHKEWAGGEDRRRDSTIQDHCQGGRGSAAHAGAGEADAGDGKRGRWGGMTSNARDPGFRYG